ncbi:MAG: methyltransferase [Actinomycetota bacterium]
MNAPASELIVRGAALYLPLTITAALVIHRRPGRRRVAGAVIAVAWNLMMLLAVNTVAQRVGWWTFSTRTAAVAGTPADLWVGWALLWGAVPVLVTTQRLVLAGLALFAVDLVAMPLATPVVVLHPTWLVGELVCIVTCLVPGLVLGAWTARGEHPTKRAVLQVIAFTGLLLYVLPCLVFTLTGESWSALTHRPRWHFVVAALVTAPATAMALQAVREFAVVGNGTPVPLDPPLHLVESGPYAYIANPMQVGGAITLATWGVLTSSLAVVAAAVMAAAFAAGLAAWNESNDLTDRFGDDWLRYRSNVRPWWPRWHPYTGHHGDATVYVGTSCEPCSEVGRFLDARRPHGLEVAPAEESPDKLTRITYRALGVGTETGLGAIGRSVEHINLAWAFASWIVRLPLVRPFLQLVADAVGAGPRLLPYMPRNSIDTASDQLL